MARARTLLVLAPLAAASFALSPSASSGLTAMCFGEPADNVPLPTDETIEGTPGDDVLAGGGGDDTIDGHGGDDRLCGGDGRDQLVGRRGDDRLRSGALYGGPGSDLLRLGFAVYTAAERGVDVDLAAGEATGEGRDRLDVCCVFGSAHADVIRGGGSRNLLLGEEGRDLIVGRGGRDVLSGGVGNDRAFGQRSDDEVYGGFGTDFTSGGTHVNGDVCEAEFEVGCEADPI